MFPPAAYLEKIEPFSFLSKSELKIILNGLESEIFGKGETIFRKDGTPLKYLYIIKCGRILLIDEDSEYRETLKEGEIFGIASVLSSNPPKRTAIADADCVCYLIRKENFIRVFNSNRKFSDFFVKILTKRLSSILKLSRVSRTYEHLYATSVIELVSKRPVVCSKNASIRDVAGLMNDNNVGSVIVVDDKKPIGIFTQRDLPRLIHLKVPLDDEIGRHMSTPVISINEDGTVMEAYLLMVSNGINHLVVMDDNKIKGIISSRDILLRLESFSSLLSLSRSIISLEEKRLPEMMNKILECIEDMASKVPFSEVSRISSGMYDLIIEKLIKDKKIPEFAWIKLGTAGRKELIFPEVHSVVIYNKNADEFIEIVENKLRNIGFEIRYLEKIHVDDVDEFIENLNVAHLPEFYDGRLLYGKREFYDKFLNTLSKRIKEGILLSARNCISVNDDYLSIVNGIRALSLEFKMLDIKNTEERCKFLVEKIRTVEDILESYRVITDIEMRRKFENKIGIIDEMLLKEARKILLDFKRFIGDRYAIQNQV
ncbi:MAG: hypothetical protein DRO94_04840 [Candidatus Altiarchaeales archaeon]|nr:MAG: hypothetical protein DRO94_04840 [Candidatus Altiarchaeales archaeon]